jgi:hypothetical protein
MYIHCEYKLVLHRHSMSDFHFSMACHQFQNTLTKETNSKINNLPLMREQMWQSHVCKAQQTEEFVANVHWLEANL